MVPTLMPMRLATIAAGAMLAACASAPDATARPPLAEPAVVPGAPGGDCCNAKNACAGKGNCKVEGAHDCRGLNTCRGKGGPRSGPACNDAQIEGAQP